MRIVALLCCLLLVAGCGGGGTDPATGAAETAAATGGTEAGAGDTALGAPGGLDDLDVLHALMVEPFVPPPGELAAAPGIHDHEPRVSRHFTEAVADLFPGGAVERQTYARVRDVVWTLGRPLWAGHDWADADGRRAVARAELRALLGEAYEDVLADARALWARAEPCMPDCEEADLWPGGRPLGAAEEAVAAACAEVPPFEPEPGDAREELRSRHQEDGEVVVEAPRPPDGYAVVDRLRDGGGSWSERGDLSAEAATGWHLLLVAGDGTREDPHVRVQSVLAPPAEVCYLLRREARHADRDNPREAAVTVRGGPGVVWVLGETQVDVTWRERDDVLMEASGGGGATTEDVLAVADGLRVERP